MHNEHIYHRDAHPRNVMVNPESLGGESDPDVYLIDFGATKEVYSRAEADDIYSDGDKRYVSDEYVEVFLAPLTKTKEAKKQEMLKKKIDTARSLKSRIARTTEWKQFWIDYEKASISLTEIFAQLERWKILSSQELLINTFTLILIELEDQGRLNQEELAIFIEDKVQGKVQPFIRNSLVDILKLFK